MLVEIRAIEGTDFLSESVPSPFFVPETIGRAKLL